MTVVASCATMLTMMNHRNLTQYRKERGLTLQEFGALLSPQVNKSTVLRWEKKGPSTDRLSDVSELTGISFEDLRPDIFKPKRDYA